MESFTKRDFYLLAISAAPSNRTQDPEISFINPLQSLLKRTPIPQRLFSSHTLSIPIVRTWLMFSYVIPYCSCGYIGYDFELTFKFEASSQNTFPRLMFRLCLAPDTRGQASAQHSE